MKVRMFQVDAFTRRRFGGNPAAVVPLARWPEDATMQAIAAENNLAETAFFVGDGGSYDLRWFTPAVEVDLCGHATLASAFVIFSHLDPSLQTVSFQTKSGELRVSRDADRLAMDFPARPPARITDDGSVARALGRDPLELWAARDCLAVYGSEEEVLALRPRMDGLAVLDYFGFIATAPGKASDFVSRFFAPRQGVPEDPVTGSSHCTLTPYWAQKLGKKELHAIQVSSRRGEIFCALRGDRVTLSGHAVQFLEGTIEI